MKKQVLLQVKNLTVSFSSRRETTFAVRGISFEVFPGEAVGIVGESGCGKTTAVQAITGLARESLVSGEASFEGINLLNTSQSVLGKKIGMVFQDPMTSLNPTMKIRSQIEEGLIYHRLATKKEAGKRALELLHLVGLPDPVMRAERYPHELSGGQRQRVAIAIALACNPSLLIADEPTTALDVTTQAQILRLIKHLQKQMQMSLILITHDLGVISQVCDRVLVFYAGKIVEQGLVDQIFHSPRHPYTQMLLASRPARNHPKSEPLRVIEGTAPSLSHPILGCSFAGRCPYAMAACQIDPPFFNAAACWRNS